MQTCDALVLSSIVEGRALVVQEAMSCGLPVVVTPNTGTTDVVVDGVNGHVVPIAAPQRIAEAIDRLASDPVNAAEMGRCGAETCADLSWAGYAMKVCASMEALSPNE
jgi:glycosyltransferase involved in cell wall biosynthesis